MVEGFARPWDPKCLEQEDPCSFLDSGGGNLPASIWWPSLDPWGSVWLKSYVEAEPCEPTAGIGVGIRSVVSAVASREPFTFSETVILAL